MFQKNPDAPMQPASFACMSEKRQQVAAAIQGQRPMPVIDCSYCDR
jgi:hypothetical protein